MEIEILEKILCVPVEIKMIIFEFLFEIIIQNRSMKTPIVWLNKSFLNENDYVLKLYYYNKLTQNGYIRLTENELYLIKKLKFPNIVLSEIDKTDIRKQIQLVWSQLKYFKKVITFILKLKCLV